MDIGEVRKLIIGVWLEAENKCHTGRSMSVIFDPDGYGLIVQVQEPIRHMAISWASRVYIDSESLGSFHEGMAYAIVQDIHQSFERASGRKYDL